MFTKIVLKKELKMVKSWKEYLELMTLIKNPRLVCIDFLCFSFQLPSIILSCGSRPSFVFSRQDFPLLRWNRFSTYFLKKSFFLPKLFDAVEAFVLISASDSLLHLHCRLSTRPRFGAGNTISVFPTWRSNIWNME